jgi:hypothetical protein
LPTIHQNQYEKGTIMKYILLYVCFGILNLALHSMENAPRNSIDMGTKQDQEKKLGLMSLLPQLHNEDNQKTDDTMLIPCDVQIQKKLQEDPEYYKKPTISNKDFTSDKIQLARDQGFLIEEDLTSAELHFIREQTRKDFESRETKPIVLKCEPDKPSYSIVENLLSTKVERQQLPSFVVPAKDWDSVMSDKVLANLEKDPKYYSRDVVSLHDSCTNPEDQNEAMRLRQKFLNQEKIIQEDLTPEEHQLIILLRLDEPHSSPGLSRRRKNKPSMPVNDLKKTITKD